MSINLLRKQVKYCLINIQDEEMHLLKNKIKRKKNFVKVDKDKRREDNIKYFQTQDKYKSVSKSVLKTIKNKTSK